MGLMFTFILLLSFGWFCLNLNGGDHRQRYQLQLRSKSIVKSEKIKLGLSDVSIYYNASKYRL